ncbi:MAG: hypothetical protein H0X25_15645, partial [Acidobacteriales bacterium]|nr:hypothetical protein [Terriglobales bacterium]
SLTPLALAQRHHDPLTDAEIDQLREAAQLPEQRLKLYVTFARERLDGVEKVQHDPKVTNHGDATHDQLQRFVDVYDELNDNVDTFAERRDDIRKVLQVIINADTEFQSKLRALQSSATARSAEAGTYEFLLSNAVDAVDQGAKDHKQTLQEQEEEAKHKKLIKPK